MMELWQIFTVAWRNLCSNRVRFGQSILVFVVGVAAMFAVLNVQQGFVNRINAIYQAYSPSLSIVRIARRADSEHKFTIADMEKVAVENPDLISNMSPFVNVYNSMVKCGDKVWDSDKLPVVGVNYNFIDMMPAMHLADGRFFKLIDIEREQRVCVLSAEAARKIFHGDALGNTLKIQGENFTVIGVLAETKYYEDDAMNDGGEMNIILIPYTNAQNLSEEIFVPDIWSSGSYWTFYYMDATAMDNIAPAHIAVREALQEKLGDDQTSIIASTRYMRTKLDLPELFKVTKIIVGASVLIALLGGVGVMNMMIVMVNERIPEIGIRKAFGATQRNIRRQFLLESVYISLIGGAIGILLGLPAGYIFCFFKELPVELWGLPVWSILVVLLFSVGLGVIFGTYPASQAAKMEIVDAINSD